MDYKTNTLMTYGDWQEYTTEYKRRILAHMEREREKRAAYYARQRAFGLLLLVISLTSMLIASVNRFDVVLGISAIVALLGVYMMLTRQMILIDGYYLEVMDKISIM